MLEALSLQPATRLAADRKVLRFAAAVTFPAKEGSWVAVLAITCARLSSPNTPRYFKLDGGTDARYIALAPDGNYSVATREHMFLRVEESGRWNKTSSRIAFVPKKPGASPYGADQVIYKGHTFLALGGDAGPSIAVPIAEIKKSLDQNPNELPLYVFFEISGSVYERETKQTYPFHFPH